MKLSSSSVTAFFITSVSFSIASPYKMPNPAPYPSDIYCGPPTTPLMGLDKIAAPNDDDVAKGAQRLAKKGGTCRTPQGDGKCVRVACNNTSGIYLCNADGKEGPFEMPCKDVAAYVFRDDGDDKARDIYHRCRSVGLYHVEAVSGQAFDVRGDWTIISGYANCNHDPENAPENPSSL